MRYLVFAYSLLIVTGCSNGHIKKIKTDEDLNALEIISREEKIKLIKQLKPEFEYLFYEDMLKNGVIDVFHFIDLDNDKDPDLIFTGYSGGEPDCVRIFANKNNKFENVFDKFIKISNLEISNNTIIKISINDPGCCASYIEFNEDYDVAVAPDSFKFTLTSRTALIYETEVPKKYYEKPAAFEVMNDKYYLRSTPKIDTVDSWYGGEPGTDNILAEFKKGTKGTALAEATDSTVRVWWYVEIDPASKPTSSHFYDIEVHPTKLLGWMSSNYLSKK